jgi:hypothetical protein
MSFKTYVEEILQNEVLSMIGQQGYVLETEICTMICDKYNLHLYIVRATLRRIYSKMALLKRRMSDDLKRFYGLEVKGYPIVYLMDK